MKYKNLKGLATHKQLSYLDSLGISYDDYITKQEASRLISKATTEDVRFVPPHEEDWIDDLYYEEDPDFEGTMF